MEPWLRQQIEEQKRLRALPPDDRAIFTGKYWYARGVFGAELLGTAQATKADATEVFNAFIEARQQNIDRAVRAAEIHL